VRCLAVSILALAVLAGCQTASYKQTKVLAGTSWRAVAPGTDRSVSVPELQFGTVLAPSGMGQVRIAPGEGNIALFQVIDEKLIVHLNGKNQTFDFDIDGNTLTLTHLSDGGEKLGTQTFSKE
jgi:hypothetical protein